MKKISLKGLKKRLDAEWSLAVRNRDGNKCVMCGKTEGLQAHHWIVRKARSLNVRWHIDNGATLCYPCHIWNLHTYADMDFVLSLKEKMDEIISWDSQDTIRELSLHKADYSYEDLVCMLSRFVEMREKNLTKNLQ